MVGSDASSDYGMIGSAQPAVAIQSGAGVDVSPAPAVAAPVSLKPIFIRHTFSGQMVSSSSRGNLTIHNITVNTGEDVSKKVLSFSQQGSRSICIFSATGVISRVTFRLPYTSDGNLTFEGRYEILSFTGSFKRSETGGIRSLYGGMSVSLSSPDRHVIGGRVAGLLVAASPVEITVGCFSPGN